MKEKPSCDVFLSSYSLGSQVLPSTLENFNNLETVLADKAANYKRDYLALFKGITATNDPNKIQTEYKGQLSSIQAGLAESLTVLSYQLNTAIGDWQLFFEVAEEELRSMNRDAAIIKHLLSMKKDWTVLKTKKKLEYRKQAGVRVIYSDSDIKKKHFVMSRLDLTSLDRVGANIPATAFNLQDYNLQRTTAQGPPKVLATDSSGTLSEWEKKIRRNVPGKAVSVEPTPPPAPKAEAEGVFYVRVLYPYSATFKEALNLNPGDIIRVVMWNSNNPGWAIGETLSAEQCGLFPQSYVERIS